MRDFVANHLDAEVSVEEFAKKIAKNLAGCAVSEARRIARLSPSSAIFLSLLSLMEITAISAQAKIALKRIKIAWNNNNSQIVYSDIKYFRCCL